jgi:hypothetical protein
MYFDVNVEDMNQKVTENIKLANDVTENTPAIEVGFAVKNPNMTLGEYMGSNFDYTKIAPGILVIHSWGLFMSFDLHLITSYGYDVDCSYDITNIPILADSEECIEIMELWKHGDFIYLNGLNTFGYCAHVNDLLMRYGNALEEWNENVIVTFNRLEEIPEKPWKGGPHIDKYLVEDYEKDEYNYEYNYKYHIYVMKGLDKNE